MSVDQLLKGTVGHETRDELHSKEDMVCMCGRWEGVIHRQVEEARMRVPVGVHLP